MASPPDYTARMSAIRPVLSQPKPPPPQRANSTPQSMSGIAIAANNAKLSLSKFLSLYHKEFPIQIRVCKGYCGPNEDTSISEGDRFNVHFVKYTTIVTVEYDNGSRYHIPLNSAVPFGILYNPENSLSDAMKGYRFETVSELLRMSTLPVVIFARKAYQGSSPDSSIAANEVLLVKKVLSKRLGTKQQLKVFSLKENREKTLSSNCAGNFSTRPKDVCLFLPEILKHLPDIFPCKAVLYNVSSLAAERSASMSGGLPNRAGSMTKFGTASVVTMMHSSIETSIVAASALEQDMANARLLDIPIDLNILVRVEHIADEDETQRLYEDATFIYEHFDPSRLCDFKSGLANSPDTQSQFYTNVNFGRERDGVDLAAPRVINQMTGKPHIRGGNSSSVTEEHYQVPRKSSDPIPIESVTQSRSSSNSREGSVEQSPLTRDVMTPPSQTWRPPLPPPRNKRDGPSPGYEYVETNPRFTRAVNGRQVLGGCASDSGIAVPSSSLPDSVTSEKSFGSTGSGGAVVGSRRNSTSSTRGSGSDSGVVEARRSTVNSQFQRGHNRSHSSGTDPNSAVRSPVHTASYPTQTKAKSQEIQRQCSAPQSSGPVNAHRPDNMGFNEILSNLDQLTKQLDDSCSTPSSSIATPSTDDSRPLTESQEIGDNYFAIGHSEQSQQGQQQAALNPETIEKNKSFLKSMDNFQLVRLLEAMGLEQYVETFRLQQINGDLLSDCDDELLKNELTISSRLHRMRLLRIISGQYSVMDLMAGRDGYVMMLAAPK